MIFYKLIFLASHCTVSYILFSLRTHNCVGLFSYVRLNLLFIFTVAIFVVTLLSSPAYCITASTGFVTFSFLGMYVSLCLPQSLCLYLHFLTHASLIGHLFTRTCRLPALTLNSTFRSLCTELNRVMNCIKCHPIGLKLKLTRFHDALLSSASCP